jgi:hypothetical protein
MVLAMQKAILILATLIAAQSALAVPATKEACQAAFTKAAGRFQQMSDEAFIRALWTSRHPGLELNLERVRAALGSLKRQYISGAELSATLCAMAGTVNAKQTNDSLREFIALGALTVADLLDEDITDDVQKPIVMKSETASSLMHDCTEKNYFGRYPKGGDCTSLGCFPEGGDCSYFGCHPKGGSCNYFGCSATGECAYSGCPERLEHVDPKTGQTKAGLRFTCAD